MNSFPLGCVPVSGQFQAGTFIINGYVTTTQQLPSTSATIPDQQLMHHGTHHNTPLPVTAQAIWDGQVILATNGSVKNAVTTYAWILSTTNDHIEQDITGGGLLPPSAPYAKHASKCPEAAALYATLQWIATLL